MSALVLRGAVVTAAAIPVRIVPDTNVVDDQLTDFLNESLDVAEARADALRLTRTAIDLSRLVETMVDFYEPSMAERGIQIRASGERGVTVNGDEGLIHRVIADLLDNEFKHLAPDSNVSIALQCTDDTAIVTVEDNGRGFEPEVLKQLFLGRVKGRTSTGHGLGLAFVDAVIQAHGGTVEAINREVRGARIAIGLPLLPKEARHPVTAAHAG